MHRRRHGRPGNGGGSDLEVASDGTLSDVQKNGMYDFPNMTCNQRLRSR